VTAGEGAVERLRIHLSATDASARARVLTLLRHAGIALAPEPGQPADTVIVAAASTVDSAIESCNPMCLFGEYRLLVVADTFSPSGVLRAVRLGVRAMLRSTRATPPQFVAAVQSAHRGDGRMPCDVLVRLLSGAPEAAGSETSLTARQIAVLVLMAQGHGNAAIAHALSCSEHTVKNVSYDMMARLQVCNRAHAVAHAIRAGLI
jgi:DNA-binding NarL/FixJ family response regulator